MFRAKRKWLLLRRWRGFLCSFETFWRRLEAFWGWWRGSLLSFWGRRLRQCWLRLADWWRLDAWCRLVLGSHDLDCGWLRFSGWLRGCWLRSWRLSEWHRGSWLRNWMFSGPCQTVFPRISRIPSFILPLGAPLPLRDTPPAPVPVISVVPSVAFLGHGCETQGLEGTPRLRSEARKMG